MIFRLRVHCLILACTIYHKSLHHHILQRTWRCLDPKPTRLCEFHGGIQRVTQSRWRACDGGPCRIGRLVKSHRRCRLTNTSWLNWDFLHHSGSGTKCQRGVLTDIVLELRWIWLALRAAAPFARWSVPAKFGKLGEVVKSWSYCWGGTPHSCWCCCRGSLDLKF